MPRLHVIVRGRVQGVFYRASAIEKARDLALTGWVRNRFDGGVEVVAEGAADALGAMRAWCVKGPAGALVRDIQEIDEAESGEFTSFGVRPEA